MANSLTHPDEAVLRNPPLPLGFTLTDVGIALSPERGSNLNLRAMPRDQRTIRSVVSQLAWNLHLCHRRKVWWPIEEIGEYVPQYYQDVLVGPVLSLFNQMRCIPDVKEVEYRQNDLKKNGLAKLNAGISIGLFRSDEWAKFEDGEQVHPISLAFLSHRMFMDSGALALSPIVITALEAAWQQDEMARVIVTDLHDLILVHPASSATRDDIRYEHLPLKGNLTTLRIMIAAYFLDSVPDDLYCQIPVEDEDFPPPEKRVTSQDPLQIAPPKPSNDSILPDATLFISHKRLSDFDLSLLLQDRERALQFYRWKEHESQAIPSHQPGSTLTAESNLMRNLLPKVPLDHQLDPSELPLEVRDHINATKRPCPLEQLSLLGRLLGSTRIAVKLIDSLTIPQTRGMCSTYTCQLTSIDGEEVKESPVMCVKIFDDRFVEMEAPDEDMLLEEPPEEWFPSWPTAEEKVRNEYMAYEMLLYAQGSLLPFFYGGHLFTLPDGHTLYGVLMEFVDAVPLKDVGERLSQDQQRQLIRSCRHGVSLLQHADVSQHDWHPGQVLCRVDSQTQQVHSVLIDFAATSTTTDVAVKHWEDDFIHCLAVLADQRTGIQRELVAEIFNKKEGWDVDGAALMGFSGGFVMHFSRPEPFEFVYADEPVSSAGYRFDDVADFSI